MARTKIIPEGGMLGDYDSVIVSYSDGIDSTGALHWAVQNFDKKKIWLLYCDTGCEYPENVAIFYKVASFIVVQQFMFEHERHEGK